MAGSVNRVILLGNVGNDPDVRFFQDGTQIVSFNLATSESWTDKRSGERKERTEWSRIVVMGNEHLTKIAGERIRKGSKVYIEGRLQTRKWEKDGVERYVTEILIGRFNAVLVLLDNRPDGDGDREDGGSYAGNTQAQRQASGTQHRGATAQQGKTFGNKDGHLDDDEIPF